MQTSEKGKQFILNMETGHGNMILEPWEDPPESGRYSIGAGVNFHPDTRPELMQGITEQKAWELFRNVLEAKERELNNSLSVQLMQHEFDALMAFVWNLGIGQPHTLIRYINEGRAPEVIASKWEEYHKVRNEQGHLVPWDSLKARRRKEFDLFYNGYKTDLPLATNVNDLQKGGLVIAAVIVLLALAHKIFKE